MIIIMSTPDAEPTPDIQARSQRNPCGLPYIDNICYITGINNIITINGSCLTNMISQ